MIYPENLERKLGFTEIRTLLKGRCMSTLGTEWVDEGVKFSSRHEDVVESLAQAEEYMRLCADDDVEIEENFFDVRQALLHIRPERTHMDELDLYDLKRSMKTVNDICTLLRKGSEDGGDRPYPALARMSEEIVTQEDLVIRIDKVLNKYGKVKDTASPDLLSIRHQIEVATRSIGHTLRAIVAEAQQEGYMERDVSPTLRDGRLVIPVAPAVKRKIKGIIHDESASGRTVYIEPAGVVEANNRIRELRAQEKREVIKILQEVTSAIRPHIAEILQSQHFLAHIDYLRALNALCTQMKAVVPNVTATPKIDLVQARHPLLEQSLEHKGGKIVPLDVRLQDNQKILLISGPNAGGKSVTLKTIGLLQYMLQCGIPVPVRENSTMGVFEDIMIDIGDEQSIENDLSTYSSHLLNMKTMMKHAGTKSLLLIDEFGGGTEPQIGGALAEAIMNRFVKNSCYAVITTHYQNLKHFAEDESTVVNGAMLYDRAQMQPLFMLQVGHPGSSFAIEIARKIGLPEEVIQYAADLVGKDYVMSDKYLQDIVRDKVYWENRRRQIHEREKRLEATISGYERDVENLHKEKKKILGEARQEAEQMLQESNARIERTIKDIKEAQADKERTREARQELQEFKDTLQEEKSSAIDRKMEQIRRRQERRAERKAEKDVKKQTTPAAKPAPQTGTGALAALIGSLPGKQELRVGDNCRIQGQTTVGRIDSINGKIARVLFGMIYTNVPLSRLEHATPSKQSETLANRLRQQEALTGISRQTRDKMREKSLHFKPEIDLRGMRGEEAVKATTLFIDDAIQLEQSRVRILHGTGTGALRQLIRQYLNTVPGVKKFHDEHVQFGGAGITVVELD